MTLIWSIPSDTFAVIVKGPLKMENLKPTHSHDRGDNNDHIRTSY